MGTTVGNPSKPDDPTRKWLWIMNYCEEHRLPPAQDWAWKEAEEAFKKLFEGEEIQC